MKTLKEYIAEAVQAKKAIPHFNISNTDFLWAVIGGVRAVADAHNTQIPVVIGMSEGERDFAGQIEMVNLVKEYRARTGYPVFVNADHTYSVERACEAIDNGFDMVIIDAAEHDYATNLSMTQQVVNYKNAHKPECLIEAELGFIGSGSNVKDSVPEGISEETMTKPEEAVEFVRETGIDLLAPSIGNVHGLIRAGKPRLHPARVAQLQAALPGMPMVLHGGSGSTDQDFVDVIREGISMVHISTELRLAYHDALLATMNATPGEIGPAKYMKPAREAVQKIVENRTALFWGF
jgi:fructose-bisphosphate aldolase, class II